MGYCRRRRLCRENVGGRNVGRRLGASKEGLSCGHDVDPRRRVSTGIRHNIAQFCQAPGRSIVPRKIILAHRIRARKLPACSTFIGAAVSESSQANWPRSAISCRPDSPTPPAASATCWRPGSCRRYPGNGGGAHRLNDCLTCVSKSADRARMNSLRDGRASLAGARCPESLRAGGTVNRPTQF